MSEHKEPIPSMIYNAAVGGHVTNSQQIIDENENKEQSQINAEVKEVLGKGGSVDSRITAAVNEETTRAKAAEKLLQEQYSALTQSDIVVSALPESGTKNLIYRVPGISSYSDYMWDGTQFVKMAEYDNAIDDEPTVGSDNLVKSGGIIKSFAITTNNLFNKETVTLNAYINFYNGKLITGQQNWWCSDFVLVKASTNYSHTQYLRDYAFYDSNKNFISGVENNAPVIIITPSNAAYIRFSFYLKEEGEPENIHPEDVMFNEGDTLLPYEPFGVKSINPDLIPPLKDESVGLNNLNNSIKIHSANLFNKDTITQDAYIRSDNGSVVSNQQGWWCSDFIPVEENTMYNGSPIRDIAWYDVNKNYISGHGNFPTMPITAPSNAAYIRFSQYQYPTDRFMFNEGAETLDYVSYYILNPYLILIADNSVTTSKLIDEVITTPKIKNKAVTAAKLADNEFMINKYSAWDGSIKELYLKPEYAYLTDSIYILSSASCFYFDGVNNVKGSNVEQWMAWTDVLSVNNNIYPIICRRVYNQSLEDKIQVGDIVGYVVFNDYETFISNSFGRLEYMVNIPYITKNYLMPQISVFMYEQQYTVPTPADINPIKISLPDKIYAVVGDTLQLFYRGMIQAKNPYHYDIMPVCSRGKMLSRYFEFTPTSNDIGIYDFTLYVKDDNGTILGQKTCKIVVVNPLQPQSQINIACFGDSLTSAGKWCKEAYRRLTGTGGTPSGLQFNNISFVGKKSIDDVGYFGEGGWQWTDFTTQGRKAFRFYVASTINVSRGAVYTDGTDNYTISEVNLTNDTPNILGDAPYNTKHTPSGSTLTKVSGTGDATITFSSYDNASQNPLWNYDESKIDFQMYANKYCNGQIDVVYTLLSWNGQSAWRTNFSSIITEVKKFTDALHRDFPNAKMMLMGVPLPDIHGGEGQVEGATGTAYADQYGILVTALNQNKAYQDFANSTEISGTSGDAYNTFVKFVNVSSQVDAEYNMPMRVNPVNTRNSETEMIGTNDVHPSDSGYMQIADVAYRAICCNLL